MASTNFVPAKVPADELNTPQSFQKHQATKKIAHEVESGRS